MDSVLGPATSQPRTGQRICAKPPIDVIDGSLGCVATSVCVPELATFTVELDRPRAGWMAFRFQCAGHQLSIDASFTPTDSLECLLDAAAFLLDGNIGERTVTFNEEPHQVDLTFVVSDGNAATLIRATSHADHRRSKSLPTHVIFESRCEANLVSAAIIAAAHGIVNGIGSELFAQGWQRPFPSDSLRSLEARLRHASSNKAWPHGSR